MLSFRTLIPSDVYNNYVELNIDAMTSIGSPIPNEIDILLYT